MELPEFLAARLDEDEAAAKDERVWFGPHPETISEHEGWLVIQEERVLREAAADRKLLAAWQEAEAQRLPFEPEYAYGIRDGAADALLLAVKIRATVHSGHAAYRPEWAPNR